MKSKPLITGFEYTADIIRQQASEFTTRETLVQPYAGSHSINWLLGHILSSRSFPLKLLGEAQVWDEDARARYGDGSNPIGAEESGVLPVPELMALFETSQRRLIAGLSRITGEQLANPSGFRENTVLDSLLYFHFHETYHVGQMTMIAELLGKRAKYLRS